MSCRPELEEIFMRMQAECNSNERSRNDVKLFIPWIRIGRNLALFLGAYLQRSFQLVSRFHRCLHASQRPLGCAARNDSSSWTSKVRSSKYLRTEFLLSLKGFAGRGRNACPYIFADPQGEIDRLIEKASRTHRVTAWYPGPRNPWAIKELTPTQK